MNRTTWRDVTVDVFAIAALLGTVGLGWWTMPGAAPWIVAIVAGRWGASTINKIQAARVSQVPESEKIEKPKVNADSGIVLMLILLGGLVARAFHKSA